MATQPNELPRWATSPPANTITAPTSLQQDEGYQPAGSATFPNGKPIRQIENWLLNLIYLWLAWFAQIIFRPVGMWANEQIVDGDTTPPTELSLSSWPRSSTVPAGWFIGAMISNGFFHRVASPGRTFTNSMDTYCDLGPDGVWDFNEVANGAGAPAVAAQHVRFFMFVTNGAAQITAGTYFKAGQNWIENSRPFRFNAGAIIDGAEGMAIDRSTGNTRVVVHNAGNTFAGVTTPELAASNEILEGDSGAGPTGVVHTHFQIICVNCRRTSTGWARDIADDAYIYVFGNGGFYILKHATADGATWDNAIGTGDWIQHAVFGDQGDDPNSLMVDINGDVWTNRDLICGRTVIGSFGDIAGAMEAGSFLFGPAKVARRSFPMVGGNDNGAGIPGQSLLQIQPGSSSGGGGILIDCSTSGTHDYARPIYLPEGVTVTAVRVYGSIASATLRLALCRSSIVAGASAVQSMKAANGGWDDFTSQAAYSEMALTIDQNNIINNNTYMYYLAVRVNPTGVSSLVRIEVEFSQTEVDG